MQQNIIQPLKKNKVPTHAAIQINLENIMLFNKRQMQKTTHCMIPLKRNVQNRQIHKKKSRLVVAWGREGGTAKWVWGFFLSW